MTDHNDLARTLWAATAPPAPETPPLEGERRADVAVVGGGYTGLSTALHLAEAGAEVVVLEAREPGWGASGRNAGMVIAGLKHDPDDLGAMLGPEMGARLVAISAGAPDLVFDLVERFAIACEPVKAGWIQPAHAKSFMPLVERRAAQWMRRGVDARVLDRDQVAAMLGTDVYKGGWHDPRGGGVQPLALVRGLARAAQSLGATIHGDSPVTRLARAGGHWRLETARGAVLAEKVVLATNAYDTGLWPGLGRSLIPVKPYQVASAPISENLRHTILPGGQVTSNTRRLLSYYSVTPDGRLLMGGRASFDDRPHPALIGALHATSTALFPHLADIAWEYAWSGWVALTRDHLPHLHDLAPGLLAGVGFQGRGLAMGVTMGKHLALHALGGEGAREAWPAVPLRPLPFQSLRAPVMGAMRAYYRLRDRLDP